MTKAQILLISVFALSIITVSLVVSSFIQLQVIAQNRSDEAKERQNEKIVTGGHGSGYGSINTFGDVLDSMNKDTLSKTDIDPTKYLREFNYGQVSTNENGTTVRDFTIIAQDKNLEVSPGVFFDTWTFNGTIPGPTIRATEGDIVRINFINNGSHTHTMHFHGIHKSEMDGVFDGVAPGGKFVYEFVAEPFGVFPYHCHVQPLEEHIQRGLYGVYIVDPKDSPRPDADEMVMVMNGYDTDFDTENNFYTVNGISNYYMHKPIEIEKDRLILVYLINRLLLLMLKMKLNRTHLVLKGASITWQVDLANGAIREVSEDTEMKIKERTLDDDDKNDNGFSKTKTVAIALIPLAVLAGMIVFLWSWTDNPYNGNIVALSNH